MIVSSGNDSINVYSECSLVVSNGQSTRQINKALFVIFKDDTEP